MMNKRIRSMIDELFSQMKMSPENLALRDELMANAQARFEDGIAQGMTEEQAFAEVAASLEDVHGLLSEMNSIDMQQEEEAPAAEPDFVLYTGTEEEAKADTAQPENKAELDLGDTLNKAFDALGKWGQSIMPQTKKFVQDMDNATGGMIKGIGKTVNKSMRDAQKAAGDVLDRMSEMTGEIVVDFGGKKPSEAKKTPDQLRSEAADLRAQAEMKEASGDPEGARELRAQAYALETQADAIEQAQAMADAQRAAAEAAQEDAPILEEKAEPVLDAEGEVNEDAFTRVVEQIQTDAKKILGDAQETIQNTFGAKDPEYTVNDAGKQVKRWTFPAAGLHEVDVQLDADDVRIEAAQGNEIEVLWAAQNVEGEPQVTMNSHKLCVRRKNPDVFKTFFSVFAKDGGEITVRVPRGYAASYKVSTTSGDAYLYELDVDQVKVTSTSGGIRLEPDAAVRADAVKAETVSGAVTISACAVDVRGVSVSGGLFISCDADKVSAESVSGKVHIEGACEEWEVNSVSGAVEMICTVVPTRKIDIDTVSATARVALPGDVRGFAADIKSMSGKIVNEFGPDRYGTCALPIHMDSMSGSLMITRL